MEQRFMKVHAKENKKVELKVMPGHFATNHSHINYYIDMTNIKYGTKMAKECARAMAKVYVNNTDIDTIICMDGCEVIGGYLAEELTKNGINSLNKEKNIYVVTPEFNNNGQMIFRDNVQPMVWNKNVLLLIASCTTGKTINRSLECIKYYSGNVVGIEAIFSAIDSKDGIDIKSVFSTKDIPDYQTYSFKDCPLCAEKRKIDAIVNSYGYSKL
ncbi:MAG: phosphoribosyltransferase [Lachnospiraceae bacterium]